jgi:cytochrome oxidase Cu insertion factor (SCO1/SenC/PrrC family)/threonine aldolase
MPRSAGSRLLRAALLVSLPLLGGACDAVREARDATYTWHGTPMDPTREAPPLALTGGGGQPFDLAAQRGKVTLVFFGYTRCPDVCPTTLADWSRARAALGADTAAVRFVFVSVDPERDTPADADAYARRFHPAFVGVSGTPGEVAAVTGPVGRAGRIRGGRGGRHVGRTGARRARRRCVGRRAAGEHASGRHPRPHRAHLPRGPDGAPAPALPAGHRAGGPRRRPAAPARLTSTDGARGPTSGRRYLAGVPHHAPPLAPLDAQLRAELTALDAAALRRVLRPATRAPGALLQPADATGPLVDLAVERLPGPRGRTPARRGRGGGAGARGPRRRRRAAVGGDHPLHHALERELAALKGAEAALLFPSGYAANAGALPALAGAGDVVYSDALNHASLVDGCRLARANGAAVRVAPHADPDALGRLLAADAGRFRRRWLVVEGVYSMDGDRYPLRELVALARAHAAFTYVDDAHATGVLGAAGRGSAEHWGVTGAIDVTVGTLGKALGTSGAFVAGRAALRELLLHRARTFVFTTGTPPALAAATLRALAVLHDEPARRARLLANARRLRAGLAAIGRPAPGADDGTRGAGARRRRAGHGGGGRGAARARLRRGRHPPAHGAPTGRAGCA